MALKHLESWDSFTTTELPEKYVISDEATVSPTISATGRTANALKWTTSGQQSLEFVTIAPLHAPSGSTCIAGFALRVTGLASITGGTNRGLFAIREASGYHFWARLGTDGLWTCGRGENGNTVLWSSSGVPITDNTWYYVEFQVVIHDTTGSVNLWVNGSNVITTAADQDTRNGGTGTWSSIALMDGIGSTLTIDGTIEIDDLYILDGTTGTGRANNTRWGDTSVKYVIPTSNGTTNEWDRTGGGSANYEAIDDATPDEDTTYVATAVVDEVDLYNLPDVTAGAYCYGVQVVTRAKKGDTGSAQIAGLVKTTGNPATEHGAPLGVASDTAYAYFLFPWDANPDSATDWTEGDLNALEIGVKKTA